MTLKNASPYEAGETRRRSVRRGRLCEMCNAPVTASRWGRPRRTCSAKCRQRYHRRKVRSHRHDTWAIKEARDTERLLKRAERFRGRADETPIYPGSMITPRDHILFEMRLFGARLENCQWCAKPMVRHRGPGARTRCCSKACRDKFGDFLTRFENGMLLVDRQVDPYVNLRLRYFNFRSKEPQAVLRFEVNVCGHCRKPYPVYGLTSRFCSKRCRQAAWRRATRLCKFCRKRFRINRSHARIHVYCSKACKDRAAKRLPPLAIKRFCPECGTSFTANRHTYTRQIYCARKCADQVAYRKRRAALPPPVAIERMCRACGTAFIVARSSDGRKQYCSRRCSANLSARNYRARQAGRAIPIPLPAGLNKKV